MNFKKFISGVSAIAIAASAFAAMTVTASAKEYSAVSVTPVIQNNFTESSGTFTSNGKSALAVADFSGLPNIASASTITINFKAAIGNQRVAFFLGDKSVRGLNAGGSHDATINYNGVGLFIGSLANATFNVNNTGTNFASSGMNATVNVSVMVDRTKGKVYYRIAKGGNVLAENTAGIAPYNNKARTIDIIELYAPTSDVTAMFKDITVSYTVSDPTPVAAGEVASFGNDEGACVYSATVTNDAVYQAETVKAVATAVGGATAEDSASVSVAPGSALEIAVIVEGKTADEIESVTVSLY